MRSVYVVLLAFSIPAASAIAQCVGSDRGAITATGAVSVVNVNVPDDAALQSALDDWNSADCNAGGVAFPQFQIGGSSLNKLYIDFHDGINPANSSECGHFSGGTIDLYAYAYDPFNQLRSCTANGLLQQNIEHEIGHYLGLGDSSCLDHIMGIIHFDANGNSNNRWLHTDECLEADRDNTTPIECTHCQDPNPGGCIATN